MSLLSKTLPKVLNTTKPKSAPPVANFVPITTATVPTTYFRITLTRSAIGLPKRTQGVLKALGLRKRSATTFLPVSPQAAGQIMRVKELVEVQEVDQKLSKNEVREARRPDAGFYLERPSGREEL